MPIGKNSIKRVANNGYSKVKSEAPDMENSTQLASAPAATDEAQPPKEAKAPELVAYELIEEKMKPRATSRKKTGAGKSAPKKKEEDSPSPSYINVGRDLPTYLL